ncbi:MAG: HAD-IIA family hydrolase [Anaerolineae bacterium]|nr:HAD-IIA family hydrolase [Anaerolineae bacterium]
MSERPDLRALRGFIFDMDGVIYRGQEVVPGAADFIAGLRRRGIPFVYLTNNSSTPAAKVAARLRGMGIEATPDEIIISAEVTAAAVGRAVTGRRALVIGEEGLRQAMAAAGFALVEDHRQADVVVVGIDRQVTYERLREAALAIRRGAPFYATNTDRTLPSELGLVPGAGAIVGFLEIATDVKPVVFGKPAPGFFLYALRRLGTPAELTAAIGDRPDTDIIGAQQAGLRTIAVLSGAGSAAEFAAMQPPPDWVFPSLKELAQAYL